jgi:hypothetical protein
MTSTTARKTTRLFLAAGTVAALLAVSASSALAGEVTGNGKLKTVQGHSFCAFSGQEDLQWFTDDGDRVRLENPVKGVPGHSQNWGQIDKATRAFLTSIGQNPGLSCNPNRSTFGE